jgi:SAM-dependent methyltransferase
MDLKEEGLLGGAVDQHWYYVSKARAVIQLLNGYMAHTVLDIGAGSGYFSKILLDADLADRAICVDVNYSEECDETHHGKHIARRHAAPNEPVDLLLFMDVLEHVDNDSELLRAHLNLLKSGGLVLVTVPAFQFLWSSHDDFLEHRRRYTVRQVEQLLEGEGLQVVRSGYFFLAILPAAILRRPYMAIRALFLRPTPSSALKSVPNWLNRLLIYLHDTERALLFRRNRLAGLTVTCIARRV